LMALQRRISRARNRRMIGEEAPVLVEGPSPETDLLWQGRFSTQAPEIDGVALINDFEGAEPRAGQMRRLRITEAHDYDLIGTLLAGTEADSMAAPPLAPGLIQIASMSPQIPVR
jgi:ribosomal protein S12 methylthiotransferase